MLTKVCLVKAMVFPVVVYGCESWTIKKAEHQRTDAFELWCWRILRVPWTARRSNQSILKEISSEHSLKELMLKLKLQHFGHLTGSTDSLEKTFQWCWERLKAGKRDNRGWDGWMASPTQWTWVWASSGSWWWTGKPGVLQSMGPQRVGHDLNWSDTKSSPRAWDSVLSGCALLLRLLVHTLTSAVARDLPPRVGRQWALWFPANRTPGALVCFCRAKANLTPDLVSAFGVLWVGQGACTFRLGSKARQQQASMHAFLTSTV